MNKYKAAFFDVDGTLLSHRTGQVPESTMEALKCLGKRGIKLVLCTGRHPAELGHLNVDISCFDDFITTNGQIVLNREREMIAENPLPPDVLPILEKAFAAGQVPMQFNNIHGVYMNFINDRVRQVLDEIHTPMHDLGEYTGEKIYQVVAYPHGRDWDWVDSIRESFTVTSWHPNGVDIITKGGGKHWGMQAYLALAGMDREETVAFGDGENDLEMIRFAGCGVAMGNARDVLKEHADLVTDDIDEDGLWNACRKLNLL